LNARIYRRPPASDRRVRKENGVFSEKAYVALRPDADEGEAWFVSRRGARKTADKKPSLRTMRVAEVMTKGVKTVESGRTFEDSLTLMVANDIGCVVVTEEGSPVGIFTERDVLRRAAQGQERLQLAMKDVMSKPLVTVAPTATIWEAMESMSASKVRHLPVVDGGALVGILTQRDMFRLFFSYKELLLSAINLEEMWRFMMQ
jgi:signal-transduction protein with cAMP-binding, CBS, and nucleotidyltransferase domain